MRLALRHWFRPKSMLNSSQTIRLRGQFPHILKIAGMAIDDSQNRNKWRIPKEDLDDIAAQLQDKPIMKNHDIDNVDAIIGRVNSAWRNENKVMYEGEISDESLIQKILLGYVKFNSIQIAIPAAYCDNCISKLGKKQEEASIANLDEPCPRCGSFDMLIRKPEVLEQSMVAIPAYVHAEVQPLSFKASVDRAFSRRFGIKVAPKPVIAAKKAEPDPLPLLLAAYRATAMVAIGSLEIGVRMAKMKLEDRELAKPTGEGLPYCATCKEYRDFEDEVDSCKKLGHKVSYGDIKDEEVEPMESWVWDYVKDVGDGFVECQMKGCDELWHNPTQEKILQHFADLHMNDQPAGEPSTLEKVGDAIGFLTLDEEEAGLPGEAQWTQNEHRVMKHGGRYAECPTCFPTRDRESKLYREEEEGGSGVDEYVGYSCPDCKIGKMKKYVIDGIPGVECDNCGWGGYKSKEEGDCTICGGSGVEEGTAGKSMPCTECGGSGKAKKEEDKFYPGQESQWTQDEHRVLGHKGSYEHCSICFPNEIEEERESLEYREEEVFECPLCTFATREEKEFDDHISGHANESAGERDEEVDSALKNFPLKPAGGKKGEEDDPHQFQQGGQNTAPGLCWYCGQDRDAKIHNVKKYQE